jgi:hypothetical protein
LLRIIGSGKLLVEDRGLLQFLDGEDAGTWRYKYPATFMFYMKEAERPSKELEDRVKRPNFFKSTKPLHCDAFAAFKPLAVILR